MAENNFIYNTSLYNTNSAKIIVPYIIDLVKPKSVIDVGCGLGTWLSVFQENGIADFFGVDQSEYNPNQMYIPESNYLQFDFNNLIQLSKKYDLAISLEVAEHIHKQKAELFVESLTNMSQIILFSAAIPDQGGQGHVNEQYPSYWKTLFLKRSFVMLDNIRPVFWNDTRIDFWYKQNMFLVVHESLLNKLNGNQNILDVIHPVLYNRYVNQSKFTIKKVIRHYLNKIK